jgi:hypothetical protein
MSLALLEMLAVYIVEKANLPLGVKIAVVPLKLTVPVIPLLNVKLAGVTEDVFMVLVKVAEIESFTNTPLELLAGLVEAIVGGEVSRVALPSVPPPQPKRNMVVTTAK